MNVQVTVLNSLEKSLSSVIRNIIHSSMSRSITSLSRVGMNIKSSSVNNSSGVQSIDITVATSRMSRTTPFDMKIGFSRSRKVHKTKDGGWYLNIPFRHKASSMPRSIYNQARQLNEGESLKVNGSTKTSWTGYQHNSNNLDGLRRMVNNTYGKYYTFRRVSNKSDPLSWWHPGVPVSNPGTVQSNVIQKTVSDFIVANINSALRR